MPNPTQAPTLDKGALTPGAPRVSAAMADQDRLVAAFRFGWGLEELVWWLNDLAAQQASVAVSSPPSSDFPPDLTHQRTPAERIRELHKLLQVDGPKLLGNVESVSAVTIGTRIEALIQTYEQKGAITPFLTGDQRIGSFVRLWDADVVDAIIDQPPQVLTAYELGKALSLTSWQIWTAQTSVVPGTPPGTDPIASAWQAVLNKDRVDQIRRHLTTLAASMDAQVIVSVSASLSFWRRAYALGELCGSATPNPTNPIPADASGRTALQTTLDQQLANWYDLLAGRRKLDSFAVTGIVSSLLRDYAQRRWSGLGPALLLAGGVLVVIVLVGVLVWAVLGGNVAAGAGAGLTGGLTSLAGFFVARGAGLLDRSSQTIQDLQGRVNEIQARLVGIGVSSQNEPPQLTFESLGRSVLAQVVAQIRLEEAKLAISQPLIDYITQTDGDQAPEQVAKNFLNRIMENDEQSNMERLENVLEGLYRGYGGSVLGAR
ncbi:MAG: hypothetical protein ACR2IK_18310 [Chloroflexota bacterium]